MRTVHIDLARGFPDLASSAAGEDIRVVWWWQGLPLGQDTLAPEGSSPRALADRIGHVLAGSVGDRLPDLGLHTVPQKPLSRLDGTARVAEEVAVVVCTRDRREQLARCLRSILAADDEPLEIVVVDNGSGGETRDLVTQLPRVRYVRASRPGLSAARNAALEETSAPVIAFVDDDAVVDRRWLSRLTRPFADPSVMAVTGLVLPLELETEAQVIFDSLQGGLGRGYRPRRFGPDFLGGRAAAPVWDIGAGCNMAVRRAGIEQVGGFDERLGAGAAGCSEDSELWQRLLAAGWSCVYEPWSVVFHEHRRGDRAMRRQARDYMRGHVAALFVQFARFRRPGDLARILGPLPLNLGRRLLTDGAKRALIGARLTPPAPVGPSGAASLGYLLGLSHARLAFTAAPPAHKAPLGRFLRLNPYPRPYTEGFFFREKMRAIHRVAPDAPFQDILEVGGGQSGLARRLYPAARVTTVDLDPSYAQAAVNRDPRTAFVTADARALPFPDASFDAVTMFDVLEHIPEDRQAAAEAIRVLRPGGWILISSPNLRWRSPYHRWMRAICPTSAEMIARWQHVRVGYDRRGLEELFGSAPLASADFINPVTVVAHDLAFSKLPRRLRWAALLAIFPVTWVGYVAQPRTGLGTETAASWRKSES